MVKGTASLLYSLALIPHSATGIDSCPLQCWGIPNHHRKYYSQSNKEHLFSPPFVPEPSQDTEKRGSGDNEGKSQQKRLSHQGMRKWHNVSARQKTQQGTAHSTMAHRTPNTCVPPPLPGETLQHVLATAKWLPAIYSFSFNESVEWDQCECQGSESLSFSWLQTPASLKISRSDFRASGVWVIFLNEVQLCIFWGRCQLSTKPTALINLIPQVSVWITAMCGWPQNKLKYLLHGIRLKGWPAHGSWIYFLTAELNKKTRGEEIFRLGWTQLRSWGCEKKTL